VKTRILLIFFGLLLIVLGFVYFSCDDCKSRGEVPQTPVAFANGVLVTSPLKNAVVQSPLKVTGEAPGTYYFEASFPVRIMDANGTELGVVPAQAQSDWMTTGQVPFEAMLIFNTPTTDTGTLILEKDNPSGLPENADSVSIPIRFK
jgi:hypothetical protein